jgi:N6-adenosine-specific RNA methylase IME4
MRCVDFYKKTEKEGTDWCEKCPEAVRQINNYLDLKNELLERGVDEKTTMVGLSERAARPLFKIKDKNIRGIVISDVENALKRKTPTGGIYKKLKGSDINKIIRNASHKEIKEDMKMITGKFNVIYTDPPWQYSNSGFEMSAENQYPTVSTQDLMDRKIIPIPDTEKDSIMFMWATNPLLEDALKVMNNWGFNYKTNIVWIKDRHTAGFYVFGQHELLLIGVKGSMLPIGDKPKSIVTGKNDIHSKKPEIVYEIIEQMYPNQKYIEMFARNKREGWTSWGNQV